MLSPVLIAAYAVFPAHAGMIPTSSPNHHPSVFPARGSMPRRWNDGGAPAPGTASTCSLVPKPFGDHTCKLALRFTE